MDAMGDVRTAAVTAVGRGLSNDISFNVTTAFSNHVRT